MYRSAIYLAIFCTAAFQANAQQQSQRRATMMGGGEPNRGKCTIEVTVDGAAEVTVRGDVATLRNLSGQPAQWRRFECTGPLPGNPADFRFAGVDGRGRQDLIRDPRNGGVAVVRIEDQQGGQEAYTFDLFWGGYNPGYSNAPARPGYDRPGYDRQGSGQGRRFGQQEAIRVCQDSIRQQAADRFRRPIEFLEGRVDDNPGRNDWIIGRIAIGGQRGEEMRYSCSVDFDSGRVRSANIEAMGGDPRGTSDRAVGARAVDSCRGAVTERMRQDGYRRVEFTSARIDDNPGRNDWVVGTAQGYRGPNYETFSFSCSVNMRDGDVRTVDVRRR